MTDVPPPLPPRLGAGLQAERRSAASDHLHMTLPGSSSGSDVDDMESDGGYTVATNRRLKRKLSRTSSVTVDSEYKYNLIDVGAEGRRSDGGVLKNSEFGKALENRSLGLPSAGELP
ncbi:hypothetical protein HPB49_006471 [Dermacentor silvarum]|uniref:Uncharacterized protein n=1 Tax=Dermacentor silvarum TaxID=543639 RepID=A0ACB8CJJ2_DERSI|nr:hypothetical protein HPB49_006471 [Dermacentor silvarum]